MVDEPPEEPDPIDELPDDLLLSSVAEPPDEPDDPVDDWADATPTPSAARVPARNSRFHLMCSSLPCRTQARAPRPGS
jgi:hypothetical protein